MILEVFVLIELLRICYELQNFLGVGTSEYNACNVGVRDGVRIRLDLRV